MSSSQLRSFRHTATVVALEILTALCDVAAAVDKEADVLILERTRRQVRICLMLNADRFALTVNHLAFS